MFAIGEIFLDAPTWNAKNFCGNLSRNCAQILPKAWQFHNFLPLNVAFFKEISQKVPLTSGLCFLANLMSKQKKRPVLALANL